jgi:hypothetical protein
MWSSSAQRQEEEEAQKNPSVKVLCVTSHDQRVPGTIMCQHFLNVRDAMVKNYFPAAHADSAQCVVRILPSRRDVAVWQLYGNTPYTAPMVLTGYDETLGRFISIDDTKPIVLPPIQSAVLQTEPQERSQLPVARTPLPSSISEVEDNTRDTLTPAPRARGPAPRRTRNKRVKLDL